MKKNQQSISKEQIDSVITLYTNGQFQKAIDKIKILKFKRP